MRRRLVADQPIGCRAVRRSDMSAMGVGSTSRERIYKHSSESSGPAAPDLPPGPSHHLKTKPAALDRLAVTTRGKTELPDGVMVRPRLLERGYAEAPAELKLPDHDYRTITRK
jgi:hypothetical protein